jgi:hypothetical protein
VVTYSCQKEATKEDIVVYGETIEESQLKTKLYKYASDEFAGRETGKPGQKLAVEYLRAKYDSLGIPPAIEGNYFQDVPFLIRHTPETTFSINGEDATYYYDYISLSTAPTGKLDVEEIVYVGYGIDHDNYSDYTNLDVEGKIVIAKPGEPKNEDGTYVITGTDKGSRWSSGRSGRRSKNDAAKEKGAKMFLYADDNILKIYGSIYKKRKEEGDDNLGLTLSIDQDAMYSLIISEELATKLVPNMADLTEPGSVKSLVNFSYTLKTSDMLSENVAAYIEGSEFPDEYIIISAHLDHVGVHDGEIYNGADDDGSGTVAILEIAEAFKQAKDNGHGPKRSIVFLHVTGEEKGLLGSRYYTDIAPIFPMERTIANLNIDMIGRTDPKRKEGDRNYIYLIGSDKLSQDLHNLSEEVNAEFANIELDYKYNDDNDPNRFYYRSDHYNFAKNNIPIIFYFNGTHEDYHKATDTPDKIEYDLLENRTRLIFYTAWEVANRPTPVAVDKKDKDLVEP